MNIIDKYKTLNKKDQLILFLLFNTFLNLIIAVIKIVTFHNRYGILLAADLYAPKEYEGKLPAIAV